jgi:hypothetical protein
MEENKFAYFHIRKNWKEENKARENVFVQRERKKKRV